MGMIPKNSKKYKNIFNHSRRKNKEGTKDSNSWRLRKNKSKKANNNKIE